MAPPQALTSEFSKDSRKRVQWAAFVKKSRLADPSLDLAGVVAVLHKFLWPVLVALGEGGSAGTLWTIGGGWR